MAALQRFRANNITTYQENGLWHTKKPNRMLTDDELVLLARSLPAA